MLFGAFFKKKKKKKKSEAPAPLEKFLSRSPTKVMHAYTQFLASVHINSHIVVFPYSSSSGESSQIAKPKMVLIHRESTIKVWIGSDSELSTPPPLREQDFDTRRVRPEKRLHVHGTEMSTGAAAPMQNCSRSSTRLLVELDRTPAERARAL